MSGQAFAAHLRAAEKRLRALGLSGRAAYAALCRSIAQRLDLPEDLWLEGPDAPKEAGLDRVPLTAELDLFGLAYERFFPEVFKAERGQFFTPRPLVELMADLAQVGPRDRVLDPTCGSGSFLVIAHGRGADVDGLEIDPELVALCRLNLKLHGANPRAVQQADLFRTKETDTWDVILANPPFSVDITHPDALRRFALTRGRKRMSSDVLFLEAAWRRLRPRGRLAVVLPHSIVANAKFAFLREWLDERFVRRAVVSLPEGIFRPFGGTASRACVLCLVRRPAVIQSWVAASITHPGYDPSRKVYRKTEPDEIAALRIQIRHGEVQCVPSTETRWAPESLLTETGIDAEVPTTRLGKLAEVVASTMRPKEAPSEHYTLVDLADIDKATGEVARSRVAQGADIKGAKTPFEEGDILFGRIRPNLNNVAMARRLDPDAPKEMCGSSEWVRLRPATEPYFTLLASRSSFVRTQLHATAGQTRPRVSPDDLPDIEVPLPGADVRARMDKLMAKAHDDRLQARRVMVQLEALYEAFGHGEISDATLMERLAALD